MKRLGFALASIHTGSSLNLLPAVIRDAARFELPLFIFPGGRLDSRPDQEYLRNAIYRLANPENLDGLVCWGSSIGGAVPVSALDRFHRSLEPLPYVTIAHKMEGHPCVSFDAYGGMKALVGHFIRVHGARRIAFIRGPETHASSLERYDAYRDALMEASLPDPAGSPLVSDPFPWSSGEEAIVQLCVERALVPGRDFDTLICSSDMMAFAAVRRLERSGFRVPDDFRVGGFNDSQESRILSSPFTTVHMPYGDLGTKSFALLRDLLDGKADGGDLSLPMEPIIRESCGCVAEPFATGKGGAGSGAREADRFHAGGEPPGFGSVARSARPAGSTDRDADRERLASGLARAFRLEEADREAYVDPVLAAFYGGDFSLARRLLDRVFSRFFENDGDIALIRDAVSYAFDSGLLPVSGREVLAAERTVHYLAAKAQHRIGALRKYETGRRQAVLNSLKCDLLCARDRDSLIPILALHLPSIGMHSLAVILHETEDLSRSLGWFCPDGLFPSLSAQFPARRLLPPEAEGHFASGAFLVQPLFMENQPLGYIVHNVPFDDGIILEELRSAIGSALKGIFLFEETAQAKRAAEEAELAKTEFFSHLGSELVEPLEDILTDLDSIVGPATVPAGPGSTAAGETASPAGIREAVAAHLERVKRYIDVTLSLTNELALERGILYPGDVVAEAAGFPPILADGKRLARAVAALRSRFTGPVAASIRGEGIELRFGAETPLPASIWAKGDLVLAERTVLLHGGDFERGSSSCALTLPWPTLSGVAADRPRGEKRVALALPGGPAHLIAPAESAFSRTVQWEDAGNLARDGDVALLWNAEGADIEDRLAVLSLRHRSELFRAPFLYRGPRLEGDSLLAALEAAVSADSLGTVLFVGLDPGDFPLWYDPGRELRIPSMEGFAATVEEAVPSLVVLPEADSEAVRLVRDNPSTVHVPVAVLPRSIRSELEIDALCAQPLVILCNRGIASSEEVSRRMRGIAAGKEILPPHTGALVKRAILYMNVHYDSQIARWKLADSVNVSEDYLTRVFHREIGLSLWEYLNRYRISLATELLLRTNGTVNEIALATGFQDQAYFCRVFKKIHGVPPGRIRGKKSE